MRHAKSSWKNNSLSDHGRPLNSRGSKDAPKIFQKLINENWIPDLILLSSSKRTQETLSNMNFNAKETKIEIMPELYLAGIDQLLISLQSILENKTTMLLGHNPGCELLIGHLTGGWHEMSTASAALMINNNGRWVLQKILRPKEL